MQWNYRMSYDWRRLLKSEILRVLVPFFLTVLWTKLPAFFVNHHQEKSAKISRTKGLFIFFYLPPLTGILYSENAASRQDNRVTSLPDFSSNTNTK